MTASFGTSSSNFASFRSIDPMTSGFLSSARQGANAAATSPNAATRNHREGMTFDSETAGRVRRMPS